MLLDSISCRWCRIGEVEVLAAATKALWIVEAPGKSGDSTLVECRSCGIAYFTADFSDFELRRMYDGYRNKDYFERRHKYEPWYTAKINETIGHSRHVVEHRRAHLTDLILDAVSRRVAHSPTRVLDVGGDEGQFIPEISSILAKAVLEVSGVRPVGGVTSVQSWKEVDQFQPDFVMMCHVLEHTSAARDMVYDAFRVLPMGGLLYLEVPLDRPLNVPRLMAHRWYRTYTQWISRHPVIFRVSDLLSLVSRRLLGRPIIGALIKQNEHINFFDESCLSHVVESFGFQKVAESVYKPSSGVSILDVSALGVLYRRI